MAEMSEVQMATAKSPADENQGHIGAKLREFRRSRGLTLKQLAVLARTSVGHLSQLERDMASPSVKTLYAISRALGLTIGQFFDQDQEDESEIQYVVRKSARRHIRFSGGIDDYRLTTDALKQLSLLYSTFGPGAVLAEPYTHEGEEAGYVVTGMLELFLGNSRLLLEGGDSFSFPSIVPHKYRNAGATELIIIWAITPPTY